MINLTGVVTTSGKYLVTGLPVDTTAVNVLKMVFENKTAGVNLGLFAGTTAEFTSGTGGLQLSDSGGPGFAFLTIIDTAKLAGKVLFVRREAGTSAAEFSLTID